MGTKTIRHYLINTLHIILLSLVCSCASLLVPDFMDVEKTYPYELDMVINGKEVKGAVVADYAETYELKFIAYVYFTQTQKTY